MPLKGRASVLSDTPASRRKPSVEVGVETMLKPADFYADPFVANAVRRDGGGPEVSVMSS